ncbi:DNA-directed DNA polymerase [Tanacetum coccineum]
MTRSFTKELITPFENPKRVFPSKRRFFETLGLVESSSPELDLFFDIEEHSEEEITEIMTKTMEQYMSKTHGNYGSGVLRPKINDKSHFELKGQYLKELRENTFSGSEHEDANEHIEKVLEIVDLFHIPEVTQDQVMLRVFPMSLTVTIHDSKGAIPTKTAADAKIATQLKNLGREIKKVNEKVYVDLVGCELCKGPHYIKDCPLKEEGNTLEEAYYTQFRAPYQPTLEESLTKFMAESAKRHEENSNLIKEIRASTNVAIRNQGALIKTLEIQIVHTPYRGHSTKDFLKQFPSQALVDLGASVSVMPFSTYTNLGLGILSHTRLTIELADRTIKQPRGITKNMLVRIDKFIFPIDFIILDIPEDDDVPLILGRPFLSTAHSKIDVYKRK